MVDFFAFVLNIALLTVGCGIAFAGAVSAFGILLFAVKGVFEFAEAYAEKWTNEMKRKYGLD